MAKDVELKWYGDRKKKQMNSAMIKTLHRGINVVDGAVKLRTPVDTGLLRSDNISSVDESKLIAQETNKTEYAPHVEFGTRYQSAQPFLRAGLIESSKKVIQIANKEAGDALGS